MADIRINALATTAASTASDDFVAVDGSANGTRKLNAFSPTFGGNLTVSGTGSHVFGTTNTVTLAGGTMTATKGIVVSGDPGSGLAAEFSGATGVNMRFNKTDATAQSWQLLATGNVFGVEDVTGGFVPFQVAKTTGNATLSGNLTVSGGQALISHSGSYANIYFAVTGSTYSEIRAFSSTGEFRTNSGPSAGWGGFLTWQTDASEKMRLTNSGNVLIGTTTDSANGKLQLATHTTSAGGIGFGTDTSLYRYGAGRLAIEHVGGIDALLFWSNSGTLRALGEADGSTNTFRVGSLSAGWSTAIVSGNNATALTLDSSQNATFAGNTTAKGTTHYFGADNSQRIELTTNNGSSQGLIEFYNRGTSVYFAARYLASSHTFEQGPIAINNTVNTVSPTSPNRTITMVIGGTTYYIHAKTTND